MVEGRRAAWEARGEVTYKGGEWGRGTALFGGTVYVVEDVAAGDPFTERNLRSIRPGHGLPPKHLPDVLGKRAARPLKRGTALDWDMVAKNV